MKKTILLFLAVSLLLSGCASSKNRRVTYIPGDDEYGVLHKLSDQQALEMVVLIYNIEPDSKDEVTVKNLVLEDYIIALSGRNSGLLKESGVFDLEYEHEDIQEWDDNEMLRMYEFVEIRLETLSYRRTEDATDSENAKKVIYLSARDLITYEGDRRDGVSRTLQIGGQVLNILLSVLVSII